MKTKLLFTIITCWLLVSAGDIVPAQELDFMRMMRSPSNREYHKNGKREQYRALWNGNGAVISSIPLWQSEEFRQELNFSPEQLTQLDFMYSKGGTMGHWYQSKAQTDPVLAQMMAENLPLNEEMRKDPYGERTPPETMRIYQEQLRKMTAYYLTETQKDVENTLTPEQMQKVREYEMALMSEVPILNPSMFECLDMTDEQRQQMKAIKKELEPEFEKIIEELVDIEDRLKELRFDILVENGIAFDTRGNLVTNDGKLLERTKTDELMAKSTQANAIQQLSKQINERSSNFMRGFQVKMLDVLTDEQLVRMQQIIDNPPEYVKKRRDQMQKERAEREKTRKEKNDWAPGPDSWRPGDPIPEEYREERNKRGNFPRPRIEN
jgi:Ni/Co efflux regulator RcnB